MENECLCREMTREELIAQNNKLMVEIAKYRIALDEARAAVEHNRHMADEEQLKSELRYRDGVIHGLKFSIRCNGISGDEVT